MNALLSIYFGVERDVDVIILERIREKGRKNCTVIIYDNKFNHLNETLTEILILFCLEIVFIYCKIKFLLQVKKKFKQYVTSLRPKNLRI